MTPRPDNTNETDSGTETVGSYGLLSSGTDTVTVGGSTTDNDGRDGDRRRHDHRGRKRDR